MLVFPNCKINLGLSILRKRADGFHDLETVFYPVKLADALEVITPGAEQDITYTSSGLPVAGNEADNLCIKAYGLLKKDFPALPAVKMHLHKAIPMGAGLGGGSADGAFALKLLNDKFHLGLSTTQLLHYAAALGSDGPFFIVNKPCLATGRGELLQEIALDLSAYTIVLVNPGIHINTGWAFSQLTPGEPAIPIAEIITQPINTWKDNLRNDFEQPVFHAYPELKNIKDILYKNGAIYAAMSGSGSSIFGIFPGSRPVLNFAENYFVQYV